MDKTLSPCPSSLSSVLPCSLLPLLVHLGAPTTHIGVCYVGGWSYALERGVERRAEMFPLPAPYVHVGGRVDEVPGHLAIDLYVALPYSAFGLQLTLFTSLGRRSPLTKSSRYAASFPSRPIVAHHRSPKQFSPPFSLLSVTCPTSGLLSCSIADPTPRTFNSLLSSLQKRSTHLLNSSTHPTQGVSRPVGRKSTQWQSTFARVLLRLLPSSRITSWCRRRGGRADAFPVQSPVGDGRLGLCGVGVSHCKAEPPIGEFLAYAVVFDR